MSPDERLSMAEQLSANFDKLTEEPDASRAGNSADDRQEGPSGAAEVAGESERGAADRIAADRARDDAGRFAKEAKEPREKLTLKKETGDAAKEPEREAGAPAKAGDDRGQPNFQLASDDGKGQPPAQAVIQPPAHWKGSEKVAWEKLPYPVKQALVSEYGQVADLRPVASVIEPYKQRFQQEFGGTDRALNTILEAWKFARQSPIDFVRDFIKHSNIDPQSLGFGGNVQQQQPANLGAEQQFVDPGFTALQQRLAVAEARVEALAQQPVQAQHAQISNEIQSFGSETDPSGKLAHPWFNDVRPLMGALMAGGQAKTLSEAYDQACYANPTIRADLMREAVAAEAAKRRAAADKARQAGGSITGSPGVARADTHVKQSARADLMANWDKLEARV